MRFRIIRPKGERFLVRPLGFIQAVEILQRARQHQARLGCGNAERDGFARRQFRLRGAAEVALGSGEVMPAHAVAGVQR